MGNTTSVVLGAGKWYVAPYTSGALDIATVAVAANLLGYTQGGATVEYTPETYTIEDDIGMVRKTFKTKAEASMKTGLLTFDAQSLSAMMSVGQLTTASGKNTFKLGGGREALKKFAVVFVYEDDDGADIKIGMIATNTSPLTLAFAKDKETVIDIEFKAEANGTDDTILVIEQAVPTSGSGD